MMTKKSKMIILISVIMLVVILIAVFTDLLVPRPMSKYIPTKGIKNIYYMDRGGEN